jgi:excisionase family DNA binding protein
MTTEPESTVAPETPLRQSDDALWDVAETAAFLKVSDSTIRRLVGRDEIPFKRIGDQLRFAPDAIRRWVQAA